MTVSLRPYKEGIWPRTNRAFRVNPLQHWKSVKNMSASSLCGRNWSNIILYQPLRRYMHIPSSLRPLCMTQDKRKFFFLLLEWERSYPIKISWIFAFHTKNFIQCSFFVLHTPWHETQIPTISISKFQQVVGGKTRSKHLSKKLNYKRRFVFSFNAVKATWLRGSGAPVRSSAKEATPGFGNSNPFM